MSAHGRSLSLLLFVVGCTDPGLNTQEQTGGSDPSVAPAGREEDEEEEEEIPLKEAKFLIEHNATAEDTGFQGFTDGEPWKELTIRGPDGKKVLVVSPKGALRELGLTELFFETNEPPNAEVPIEDLLAAFPEGRYEFEAKGVDGVEQDGEARLSHVIPAKPNIVTPAEGQAVDPANVVIDWDPVTRSITGGPADVVFYQVIVEKIVEDPPPTPGFFKLVYSVHVPASVTAVSVTKEFFQPATAYRTEVLAIEAGGNQTIVERDFETR